MAAPAWRAPSLRGGATNLSQVPRAPAAVVFPTLVSVGTKFLRWLTPANLFSFPPSPPFLIWRILSVPLTVARGWQPYPLLVRMSLFCSVFFLVCVLKQEEKGLPLKMYGEIKRDFVSFLSLSHDLAMRPCGMWNRGSLRLQVWATAPKHNFCIMGSFSGILRI